MKKITYKMKLLSSLIVSPRSGEALYKGIDEFLLPPVVEIPDSGSNEKHETKVVYPFYQYGEYEKYDPEDASYYLPGSSIKGALRQHKAAAVHLIADDILIPNDRIVLRNLWKAQYLEEEEKANFKIFFDNVGIEMITDETELDGEFYMEENIEFSDILGAANQDTKGKMSQMCEYLQMLLKKNYTNEKFKENLSVIERKLSSLRNESDVILIGGYKGLLHSILLDHNMRAVTEGGGLFIDYKTMLPHGLLKIRSVMM